jgi:hypothetical protein
VSWVVGQNFGFLASGTATDPNTGPLLALAGVSLLGIRTPSRWARYFGGRSGELIPGTGSVEETVVQAPAAIVA